MCKMKILMTLITLLKFTRFTQGQEVNPFRPSFGFRNSLNDTNLSFGLNDQVASITHRFVNRQLTSNRPVIPKTGPVIPKTRPAIPNFPTLVSKTKTEVKKQNVIQKSRFPNFPTNNNQQKSNVQNILKQNTIVKPNIPNFPQPTGGQTLLNRVTNPKTVLFNFNTPPVASSKSGTTVSKTQSVKSIAKKTSSQKHDISSLETVKEGLGVANQLANQISEDAIRKKFIDFFIKNSKNKNTAKKKSGKTNNVVKGNNQLPIVSAPVSGFNPMAQIANFMNNARSNSTGNAPMTFFIGPLLVPAHVLENARDDSSGQTVTSPLIALPFGPPSESSQSNPSSTGSTRTRSPSATSRVSPAATNANSGSRRNQNPQVVRNQPIVRPAIRNGQVRSPQRPASSFRRMNSDIQNILEASQSVAGSRNMLNRVRPQPVSNANIRNNLNAINNNRITVTRTRVRQPVIHRRLFNINRSLVPINVAQQTVQAIRMRNQLSRQSNARSRIPRTETSIHVSVQQPAIQQNSVDLSMSPQNSILIQNTPGVSTVRTQVNRSPTPGVSISNTPEQGGTRNQNPLPSELSQFFLDPTQLSAAELAQLSQQNNQNQMVFTGANPLALQQPFQPFQQIGSNSFEFPMQTTQNQQFQQSGTIQQTQFQLPGTVQQTQFQQPGTIQQTQFQQPGTVQQTQFQVQSANGQQNNMLPNFQNNMFPGSPFQPPMFNNFQGPMPWQPGWM